jgi:hypothetical protein
VILLFSVAAVARAQAPVIEETHTRLWPATVEASVLIGGEPHGARGVPISFGIAGDLLWKGRLGGFAAVLASEGTPIQPVERNGVKLRSLSDRISVPIAFEWRPFTTLGRNAHPWVRQLLAGIQAQVGLSVEHLRTNDDSQTTAGLHLAAGFELPIWGGPTAGGLTVRFWARLSVTNDVALDTSNAQTVFEPGTSGQIYGGICYYP